MPRFPSAPGFIVRVYQAYASLMQFAVAPATVGTLATADPSLGGISLYTGELDEAIRPLIAAANIAGAATFAASAQLQALRQAQRDGLIDFLVNSLDEALRILKNEIRKRQPVAVAVSLAPNSMEFEMLERGVLPDLLPPLDPSLPSVAQFSHFLAQGTRRLAIAESIPSLLIWPVPAEFVQRPAALDALLLEHLPPADHVNRRWLRLSPRYLGPAARRFRSVACDAETASNLIARIGQPIKP